MAFLRVSKRRVQKSTSTNIREKGIVYILKMWLGNKDALELVYKIGITTRRIEDRMMELSVDHFRVYRYMPMMYPKKFTKTSCYFQMETELHQMYAAHRYYPDQKIDGGTELFTIPDEDKLLKDYETLIEKYKDAKTPRPKKVKKQSMSEDEIRAKMESYGHIEED